MGNKLDPILEAQRNCKVFWDCEPDTVRMHPETLRDLLFDRGLLNDELVRSFASERKLFGMRAIETMLVPAGCFVMEAGIGRSPNVVLAVAFVDEFRRVTTTP